MSNLTNKETGLSLEQEKAKAAIKNFRAMQPQLTAYARAISKRKDVSVQVVKSGMSSGFTDGTTIFLIPPMMLGEGHPHTRELCDKRGEDGQQRCKACYTREHVLAVIYHELAHICFDTFAPVSERDKVELTLRATREGGSSFAKKLQKRYESAPKVVKNSYAGLTQLFNEFLPLITNALEDARVNSSMFRARPGTKAMMEANTREAFEKGVQQSLSEVKLWKDYPVNLQVIVGAYCRVSGYNYQDWLTEEVIEDLEDEALNEQLNKVHLAKSAGDIYNLSFGVLEELRRLGYCKSQYDEEEETNESQDGPGGEDDAKGNSDANNDADSAKQSGPGESTGGENDSSVDQSSPATPGPDSEKREANTPEDSPDSSESSDEDSHEVSSALNSESDVNEPAESSGEQVSKQGEVGSGAGEQFSEDQSISDDGDGGGADKTDFPGTSPDSPGSHPGDEQDPVPEEPIEEDKGDASEIASALDQLLGHLEGGAIHDEANVSRDGVEGDDDEEVVRTALTHVEYFKEPSRSINEVLEIEYNDFNVPEASHVWHSGMHSSIREDFGLDGNFDTPEAHLGPALLRMRVAFADNQRASHHRNLKSGKVDAKVLGKRAFHDDPRLFKKKTLPGKKDYFVAIALDASGSTVGENLKLMKRAAMAQATLLDRMGIRFSIFAHSGGHSSLGYGVGMHIYHMKHPEEPWSEKVKGRLRGMGFGIVNLDGHAMEFLRRTLDRERATNKIGLYYSDGEMPAENYAEELEILQREIRAFQKSGYLLKGIGIRTDSPSRHGLDTVEVHKDEDLVKVVKHIEQGLIAGR